MTIKTIINKMMTHRCCNDLDHEQTDDCDPRNHLKPIMTRKSRRKLWELEHNYHCAVIGTCLTILEVRNLLKHFSVKVAEYSDYEVHTIAVTMIENNDSRTKKINNHLDRKFKTAIQRIKKMDSEQLKQEWRNVLNNGDMIGTFWAIISHPLADNIMQRDIYGDIHMLSHLSGASNRADLKKLKSLQSEQLKLHEEIKSLKKTNNMRHNDNESLKQINHKQLQTIVDLDKKISSLQATNDKLQHLNSENNHHKMEQQIEKLTNKGLGQHNRIHLLNNKNKQLISQIVQFKTQQQIDSHAIDLSQQETKQLQEILTKVQQNECSQCEPKDESLCGRCILYVGGQTSMTPHYKEVVERKSAVFLHHDGGIEKNTQELTHMLNRADMVICPTNCISHEAYWQIKKSCKKQNKPCKFINSSGVSSLNQVLNSLN